MSGRESRIEPDTVGDTDRDHDIHSIAISLKRIADVLTAPDLTALGNQVESMAWNAGRAFEAGRRQ